MGRHPQARITKAPPLVEGARWIPLTKGRFTLVDDANYEELNVYSWCIGSSGYAERRENNRLIRMHVVLMGNPVCVDHKNRNKLDNRIDNLRVVSNAQNSYNRGANKNNKSGFKGVSLDLRCGKWRATIAIKGRQTWLGYYDTAIDAARAYDQAARDAFGEFAKPNFEVT